MVPAGNTCRPAEGSQVAVAALHAGCPRSHLVLALLGPPQQAGYSAAMLRQRDEQGVEARGVLRGHKSLALGLQHLHQTAASTTASAKPPSSWGTAQPTRWQPLPATPSVLQAGNCATLPTLIRCTRLGVLGS